MLGSGVQQQAGCEAFRHLIQAVVSPTPCLLAVCTPPPMIMCWALVCSSSSRWGFSLMWHVTAVMNLRPRFLAAPPCPLRVKTVLNARVGLWCSAAGRVCSPPLLPNATVNLGFIFVRHGIYVLCSGVQQQEGFELDCCGYKLLSSPNPTTLPHAPSPLPPFLSLRQWCGVQQQVGRTGDGC